MSHLTLVATRHNCTSQTLANEFPDLPEFDEPDYDFIDLKKESQLPEWMTMETQSNSKCEPMTDLEYALAKSEEEGFLDDPTQSYRCRSGAEHVSCPATLSAATEGPSIAIPERTSPQNQAQNFFTLTAQPKPLTKHRPLQIPPAGHLKPWQKVPFLSRVPKANRIQTKTPNPHSEDKIPHLPRCLSLYHPTLVTTPAPHIN